MSEDSIKYFDKEKGETYRLTYSEMRFFRAAFMVLLVSNLVLIASFVVMVLLVFTALDVNNFLSRGVNALEAMAG